MGATFYLHHIRSCASSAPGCSHGSKFCSARPSSGDGDLNSGGANASPAGTSVGSGVATIPALPDVGISNVGFNVGLASTSVGTGAATIPTLPDVGINNGGSNVCLASISAGTSGIASIPTLHDVGGGVHAGLATLPLLLLAVLVRLPCKATSGCTCDAS